MFLLPRPTLYGYGANAVMRSFDHGVSSDVEEITGFFSLSLETGRQKDDVSKIPV